MDISLVSRLQNRIKELDREKGRLLRELDGREELVLSGDARDTEKEIYDTIKVLYLSCFR